MNIENNYLSIIRKDSNEADATKVANSIWIIAWIQNITVQNLTCAEGCVFDDYGYIMVFVYHSLSATGGKYLLSNTVDKVQ